MNIYVAPDSVEDLLMFEQYRKANLRPLSVLKSLPYLQPWEVSQIAKLKAAGLMEKFALDAGTYTLDKQSLLALWHNRYVEYIDLILEIGPSCDLVSAYDIDFHNPELNQDYYFRMRDDLSDPAISRKIMPVVHDRQHADEEMMLYIDAGAEYIAIGSHPPIPQPVWSKIHRIREEHEVPIHLFGNLRSGVIKRRLPESLDTSRYASDLKWDTSIYYWNSKTMELEKHALLAGTTDPKIEPYLRDELGMTKQDVRKGNHNARMANLYALQVMQDHLTEVWYPEHDTLEN